MNKIYILDLPQSEMFHRKRPALNLTASWGLVVSVIAGTISLIAKEGKDLKKD